MGPITSFNRTPVPGDTYNVLVTQQDENDAEIASYFCQLKFTQAIGGAFMSKITNLTKATGKVGDTINLAENQSLTIGNEIQIKNEAGTTVLNLDVTGSDSFQIKISGEPAPSHEHISGDSIIVDQAPGAYWKYANAYYEISGVPTSSTSGTLPNDNGWTYLTSYPTNLRLLFNHEFYQFADNQHTPGKLVFSHVGYENDRLIVKTITITLATRQWALETVKPATNIASGYSYLSNESDGSNIIGYIFYTLPTTYNMDVNTLIYNICDLTYWSITGYITYNGVTEPVVAADTYDLTAHTINIYTPTHTVDSGGISCYTQVFAPDYVSLN